MIVRALCQTFTPQKTSHKLELGRKWSGVGHKPAFKIDHRMSNTIVQWGSELLTGPAF